MQSKHFHQAVLEILDLTQGRKRKIAEHSKRFYFGCLIGETKIPFLEQE